MPRGVRVSRHHANRGSALEGLLDLVHARYSARGAYCQRNPTAWRVVGREGATVRVVPGAKSPPDYLVAVDGCAWLLEAKQTARATWPLSGLEPHQAAAFDRWCSVSNRHGAGVVLMLGGRTYWLDWSWLGATWRAWSRGEARRGEASIGPADLRLRVECAGGDWMSVAGRP